MSYTSFSPETRVNEGQDATAFRIWDNSTWNGESAITTFCVVRLYHYDVDGVITEYDDYELISGAVTTKYDEYLDIDGHTIDIEDLTIAGASAGTRFADGYYIVQVVYSDGTYAVADMPYYDNTQAFLAQARCMARKLPAKLVWPMTDAVRESSRDIQMQRMYLDAAEDSADLNKEVEYRSIIDYVNAIFTQYSVSNCF